MYFVLEGLDGTGKTTFASELIKEKVFSRPIYVYFEKEDTYENTRNAWTRLINLLKNFNANIILDRSIVSTIAYQFEYRTSKDYEQFIEGELFSVLDLDPSNTIFIYFAHVFDSKKLLEYANRIESIRNNYHLLMNLLRKRGYKIIVYGGEKNFNIF